MRISIRFKDGRVERIIDAIACEVKDNKLNISYSGNIICSIPLSQIEIYVVNGVLIEVKQ